jgi:hypothetical protein
VSTPTINALAVSAAAPSQTAPAARCVDVVANGAQSRWPTWVQDCPHRISHCIQHRLRAILGC